MKCNEFELLQALYQDSELDPKTSREVERHLANCPDCAHAFAKQQNLDSRLTADLKKGHRTAELWERIEASIVDSAPAVTHLPTETEALRPHGLSAIVRILKQQLYAVFVPSSKAWAGLAAAWAIILVLNYISSEPGRPSMTGNQAPSAAQMRFALEQKQLLMVELGFAPEPRDKPKAGPSSPRSDLGSQSRNV